MNLKKIFDAQKVLMDRIEKEHPAKQNENRFAKRTLATIVELGECANDWRGFKFWSKDQEQRPKTLEEYVDVFHFIMELGIECNFHNMIDLEFEWPECHEEPTVMFLGVIDGLTHFFYEIRSNNVYRALLVDFIYLGAALGFTWEEVEKAYLDKNAVNHARQESGY